MTNLLLFFIVLILTAILLLLTSLFKKNREGSLLDGPKMMHSGGFRKKDKYVRNGISKALALEFRDRIIEKMEAGEYYLEPDFKLEDLAQLLSLSKHQTSFILNQEIKLDFNSFINKLRVEKAKELLSTEADIQVGEVIYRVGFNNSSTFNRAFKKFVHMTPKEYLLEQQSKLTA